MSTFCIIIPIYREPTVTDLASINQLFKVTEFRYDIYLAAPNTEILSSIYKLGNNNVNLHNITFAKEYFVSTESYSELLESSMFWESFNQYDYAYIYQTDCWVFRDEFQHWVNRGFDYIGAPIIANNAHWDNVPAIGNGGFSLRRISKFVTLTNENGWFWKKYGNTLKTNKWRKFEDLYFMQECAKHINISSPIFAEAVNFAWDMNPDVIYKQVMQTLPFAIHAFTKNIPFWKKFIPEITDEIYKECYESNKQFIDIYYKSK